MTNDDEPDVDALDDGPPSASRVNEGAHDDVHDDLDGFQTSSSRFARRVRGWVAALVTIALLASAGGWALNEWAFSAAGDTVEQQLGDDADLGDAMLLVRSTNCLGQRSTGSAFAMRIDDTTVVVTNRHVVEGGGPISVRPLTGGTVLAVAAYGLASDVDVAVLELDRPDAVPLALHPGPDPVIGDEVRVVGFPRGIPATRAGVVDRSAGGQLLLDLAVNPGASGSPVIDDAGRVVGQVFARTDDGRGVATSVQALLHGVRTAQPGPDC